MACTATNGERHVKGVELGASPARAYAEQDPARSVCVEDSDLLGQQDRLAQWRDHDRGPEPDTGGARRDRSAPAGGRDARIHRRLSSIVAMVALSVAAALLAVAAGVFGLLRHDRPPT